MPGFRRWGKAKFERNPESSFKLLAVVLVITFYLVIKEFQHPTVHLSFRSPHGATIQYAQWNGTGKAHEKRAEKVRDAMKYTFQKYREAAWGYDDVLPVSGGNSSSRNGWGAFIVDSASTLVLMGLWEEFSHSIEHILGIDFEVATGLVDPFETTIRYVGGLLSIVDLYDAGLIPQDIMVEDARDLVLEHAITLAAKLAPAYDTPTGMPWPRVDFERGQGEPDPNFVFSNDPNKREFDHPAIGPARLHTREPRLDQTDGRRCLRQELNIGMGAACVDQVGDRMAWHGGRSHRHHDGRASCPLETLGRRTRFVL
jgi:mannosyl-oligosaccharide alpha-1,2-mannosidase